MKIKKVEIEGFRAYKLRRDGTFDFTVDGENPSNFVAIYAPNGFGKSSFYDAVEWAFTNNLERYVRDQNRKNNELAAKGTKTPGVPQYILRNKDADTDSATSVSVITTEKVFSRTLGTIRHDSRDIRFNESDTEEGSEVFRRIILSQDAIDRFLREVKPQERYNLFMEYFGGESERLRQEITAILSDNRNMLDSLRRQRADLEAQLQEPADDSVFSAFNAVATSLNNEGESLKLVTQDFSAKTEHEILAFIVARIHELTSLRDVHLTTTGVLSDQLSRLPEIQSILDSLAEQKPRLTLLQKGVEDFQRHEQLLSVLDKCNKDLQSEGEYADFLRGLETQIPGYLAALPQLRAITERQSVVTQQKSDVVAQLAILESSVKLYGDQLLVADKKSLEMRTLQSESGATYKDISSSQARLIALEREVGAKRAALEIELVDRNKTMDVLNKLATIEVDLQSLVSQDVSILNLSGGEVFELEQISHQLNSLDAQENHMRRIQETVTKQVGLVEHLVLLGLDYVNAWSTDTCPLCQAKHPSAGELKAAVEGNSVVSAFAAENAKALEEFNRLKEQLMGRLDSILMGIRNKKASRIAELQTQLSSLGEKIGLLEREIDITKSQAVSTQQYITNLQAKVLNLSQDDLVLRLNSELQKLGRVRSELLTQLTNTNNSLESLKSQSFALEAELSQLRISRQSIIDQPSYEQVGGFIKANGISVDDVNKFHSKRLQQSLDSTDALIRRRDKILADNQALQAEMLAEGNWVQPASLVEMKDSTERHILDLEKIVQSFFEVLEKILPMDVDRNLEAVRVAVSKEIERVDQLCGALGEKIDKFELLQEYLGAFKPYIRSLALRESLFEVEMKLSQHMLVDTKLSDELNIIFENLRERIDAFFYTDLINAIYSKIDPHPSFKRVDFVPDFSLQDRPGLNIVIADESDARISPNLYFSAAQLNILSLSVFLARALHAKDNNGGSLDMILIDDPIQSMDSINVLATIDLLRNLSLRFNKQIIISTHDENFFGLLQRKIPSEIFDSKFITLESFGVVAPLKWRPPQESVAPVPKAFVRD